MMIDVAVNWTAPLRTTQTAATVEVDVMPFLARVDDGGPFDGYMTALENLGATHVRLAPWFGYPRVAVTEWERSDCKGAGSTWNSTLLDAVLSDFMVAVCGPSAAKGECIDGRSVAPQL